MPPFKVAVYLYPGADILDFSGPIEIYSTTPKSGPAPFAITTFAHHDPVTGGVGALVYKPNARYEDVASRIAEYDILVIPGASFEVITDLIKSEEGRGLNALLRTFVATPPRRETGKRVLHSVCSGSFLLAAAGVLAGRTITTHHFGLEEIKKIADEAAGGESNVNVVRKRWVDAGTTEAGVRIINAAGVSSGIDTTLWIVEQLVGKEVAEWAAEIAEFERRDAGWGVTK